MATDSESNTSITSDKLFKGKHPMPSSAIGLQEENFQAHAHFVLPHKPWELLNALKIFKVIINVSRKTNC